MKALRHARNAPRSTSVLAMLALAMATGCGESSPEIRTPDPETDLPASPSPAADAAATETSGQSDSTQQVAVLAGGCFWCTEAVFEELKGVGDVISGYAGGEPRNASYKLVSAGSTDHAEAIQIPYDSSQITYAQLLQVFFTAAHDPTQLNRQGPDYGRQYRSAIFYANEEEKRVAEAYIAQLEEAGTFKEPIATTLEPLHEFFEAEDYHQNYARIHPKQPYVQRNSRPKVLKVRKLFPDWVVPR